MVLSWSWIDGKSDLYVMCILESDYQVLVTGKYLLSDGTLSVVSQRTAPR
jgi:hypothetical protein